MVFLWLVGLIREKELKNTKVAEIRIKEEVEDAGAC
jgi:hypothetical protein